MPSLWPAKAWARANQSEGAGPLAYSRRGHYSEKYLSKISYFTCITDKFLVKFFVGLVQITLASIGLSSTSSKISPVIFFWLFLQQYRLWCEECKLPVGCSLIVFDLSRVRLFYVKKRKRYRIICSTISVVWRCLWKLSVVRWSINTRACEIPKSNLRP